MNFVVFSVLERNRFNKDLWLLRPLGSPKLRNSH